MTQSPQQPQSNEPQEPGGPQSPPMGPPPAGNPPAGPPAPPPVYGVPGPQGGTESFLPASASGPGVPSQGLPPYQGFPSSYGVPALPEKSSRRGWTIGLSIGAVVLLLCCGCVGLFGFLVYRIIESDRDAAQAQAAEYLDYLVAERYDRAYDLLCEVAQARQGKSEWIAEKQNNPRLTDYDIKSTAISESGNLDKFEVKVEQEFADGKRQVEYLTLEKSADTWFICP